MDPALTRDVARWVEALDTGGGAPVLAFREANEEVKSQKLSLIRQIGGQENRLFHSDNLTVLDKLSGEGKRFRCVYIDPPFGTGQQFVRQATNDPAYCDGLDGSEYLAALRRRLVMVRELLEEDGSLFLHLGSAMVAEAKIMLDEIFGRGNFRSWITRRKCSSKNFTRKSFGDVTDFILFYSKSKSYIWNRPLEARTPEQEEIDFPKLDSESGERYALVPLHAPGRRNGATGGPWRGTLPPKGKHWQWTPDKLDSFDAAGDIYWTRNGTPRRKIWAKDSPGTRMTNLLVNYRDPFNQNFSTTGYPTEKNQELIKLLIEACTEPGDSVLDCYCGSGTALHAAAEAGRSWVGVDKGDLAIALTQRRLIGEALSAENDEGGQAFGFRLWGDFSDTELECAASLEDIEFVIHERRTSAGHFEVIDLFDSKRLAGVPLVPGKAERIVAYDHSGQMVGFPDYEQSQVRETRPA
jgi:adenine-specific DNA-methyltransferase